MRHFKSLSPLCQKQSDIIGLWRDKDTCCSSLGKLDDEGKRGVKSSASNKRAVP